MAIIHFIHQHYYNRFIFKVKFEKAKQERSYRSNQDAQSVKQQQLQGEATKYIKEYEVILFNVFKL